MLKDILCLSKWMGRYAQHLSVYQHLIRNSSLTAQVASAENLMFILGRIRDRMRVLRFYVHRLLFFYTKECNQLERVLIQLFWTISNVKVPSQVSNLVHVQCPLHR